MPKKYLFGIDVGGTKTHAVICDATGLIVSVTSGDGANWESVGLETALTTIQRISGQALDSAGLTFEDISSTTLAMAGADWDEDAAMLHKALVERGFPESAVVVNDALAALYAGTRDGIGCVSNAGTAGKVIGRDKVQTIATIGGVVGEGAGALQISMEILTQCIYAFNGREEKTPIYYEVLGDTPEVEFFRNLTRKGYHHTSSIAPKVFEASLQGDRLAILAVERTALDHANDVIAIAKRLEIESDLTVVCSGGLQTSDSHIFNKIFRERVMHEIPYANFTVLRVPPVVGSLSHAAERVGLLNEVFQEHLHADSLIRKEDFLYAS